MEYINKIFVQYFNMIFRYVLLQHESALHDGVLVRILLNMSVKHNMFFARLEGTHQFEEFNSLMCSFVDVNILLTTVSATFFI